MPEAPPVRMVHLGIGNFHRAHQAWYTARAPDSAGWGIAGFTSRRPDMAEQLGPQDGLYTLITRGATGDDLMLIGALAAVHPSTDHGAYLDYLRRSGVAVITITVTEVGYQSLLAYAGSTRGHGTIDEAIADAECRSWVEEFWSEAGQHLILGSDAAAAYTSALLERFGNRRVRHQLSQIAPDGSRKLPIRIFPDAAGGAGRGSDADRLRDRHRGLGAASSGARRTGEG
jgi:mannitol-1-phosphate/altronate dehydrogenase